MFDQSMLAQLEAGYQTVQPKQPQPKAQNNRKSWLSAIPSIAAAGASFIPGVGTAGAAALGGLGELGRQALSGGGFDIRKVGEEAALSAVPGGLGKLGKLAFKGLKGGATVAKAAKTTRDAEEVAQATKAAQGIPIKYIESGATGKAVPVASSKGIPVKSVDSTSTGTGTVKTANKTLTNPTVQDIENTSSDLVSKGYKTSSKVGKIVGRQGLKGRGGSSVFEQSKPVSVVSIEGKKTEVPIRSGQETVTTLPAKPQPSTGTKVAFQGDERVAKTIYAKPQKVQVPTTEDVKRNGILSRVKDRFTASPDETTLSAIGGRVRGSSRNITAGEKIPGTQDVLDQQTADRINQVANQANRGVTARTPRGQLRGVQDAKKAKGAELEQLTTRFDNKLDDKAYTTLGKTVDAERGKIVGFDPAKKEHVDLNNNFAQRVGNAKSIKELEDQRKYFDKEAKRILTNPDTKGSLQANLAKAYRDSIDNYVSKVNPALKTAKGEYRDLSLAEDFLSKPGTLKPQQNIGVGRLPVAPVRAAQEATGKALQAIGSQKPVARFARGLTGQAVTRAVAPSDQATSPQDGAAPPLEGEMVSGTPPGAITPGTDSNAASGGKGEVLNKALQAAMLQALAKGDYQGISAIKSVMDTFTAQQKSQKPLSAESAKVVSNAQTGIKAIDDFHRLIAEDPSAFSRSNIPGKGVIDDLTGGRLSGALGTSSIDAAGDQIVDIIARLRTGAAISKQEEERFKRYIPRSGDSQEAKALKLNYLRDQFQTVAERSGGAGNDTQQLLTQGS